MCGIVGMWAQAPSGDTAQIFESLARESLIRGLHAFGAAWDAGSGVTVRKWLDAQTALTELRTILPGCRSALWHNRYSTSGNWRDLANNQPLVLGDTLLVFNGVLDMSTRTEMESQYGFAFPADNDGYIFLDALRSHRPVESLRGSFAGLWLHTDRDGIWAMRNAHRPLWIAMYRDAIFAASTRDIFARATKNLIAYPLPMNTCVRLDNITDKDCQSFPNQSYAIC